MAWAEPQHLLFQLANGCFLVSYLSPNSQRGLLALHAVLILGTGDGVTPLGYRVRN